jgi:AraC-like DNA-binding protein
MASDLSVPEPPSSANASFKAGAIRLQLFASAPYSARDPAELHTLGVAFERQHGVHAIGSDRRCDFDTWPGMLAYTPAGLEVFSESPAGGEYLAARWMRHDTLLDTSTPAARLETLGRRDALAIAAKLRRGLLAAVPDSLELEQWALQFVALSVMPPLRRRGVPAQFYARVLDLIAAEYERTLPLAQLAALCGQSELAFLRGFTHAFGMTPHAFVTATRVQAARRMMERSPMALAEIAAACGFAHQSHMGLAFQRQFGMSAGAYRRLRNPRAR